MILASPYHRRLSPSTIDEIVDWVDGGGRLLLLGYEYGDRHHQANLGDLARRFGIHPNIDIVGPPRLTTKPYGEPVTFQRSLAEPDDLTDGLEAISLRNVQTAIVEPGGVAWLTVGTNSVYRPADKFLDYIDGVLIQPGLQTVSPIHASSWMPVGVTAPKGLTGKGQVRFVGTWRLLDKTNVGYDDGALGLTRRLFVWLSGDDRTLSAKK